MISQAKVNNIPREMRDARRWTLYRWELKKGAELKYHADGKPYLTKETHRKVPYQRNGHHADCSDPSTWLTFNQLNRIEPRQYVTDPGYDGLQFACGSGWIAVDSDKSFPLTPTFTETEKGRAARDIVDTLQTYTEVSPSGIGIRCICRGEKQGKLNQKNPKLDIEIFGGNHFASITGDVFEGRSTLSDWQEFISERYIPAKPSTEKRTPTAAPSSLQEALEADADLNAYYNGKRPSEDESVNDWVFMKHLKAAGYGKWEAIAIFRASPYAAVQREEGRTKMDDDKYMERTYDNADGEVNNEKLLVEFAGDESRWHEIPIAKLYSERYKNSARYVPDWKSWAVYRDGVWVKKDSSADELLQQLILDLFKYCNTITDSKQREKYFKFVSNMERLVNRRAILTTAIPHSESKQKDFDSDPWLLNCPNGILKLRTGEFIPHDPGLMMTKMCGASYNPEAHCEDWEKFKGDIMCHKEEWIAYLKRWMGWGLTGDISYRAFLILHGATTTNGKTTLCNALLNMMGDYGCCSRPETFTKGSTGNGANSDLAALKGIRLSIINEMGESMRLDAETLKAETGKDQNPNRKMYEELEQFEKTAKFIFNTNDLPIITTDTLFQSNRVRILPFLASFEGVEDLYMDLKLSTEEARSAMLNDALAGLKDLLQRGKLDEPKELRDAINAYRYRGDAVLEFLNECVTKGEKGENIGTMDLFTAFITYCKERNIRNIGTLEKFSERIKRIYEVGRPKTNDGKQVTSIMNAKYVK